MTPLEVVKMYNEECWNGCQPDRAGEILADTVVRNYPGERKVLTREESIERIRVGIEENRDFNIVFHHFIDGGDKITLIWDGDRTDHEGKNHVTSGIEVFRVEDGKICEVWNAAYSEGMRWP